MESASSNAYISKRMKEQWRVARDSKIE